MLSAIGVFVLAVAVVSGSSRFGRQRFVPQHQGYATQPPSRDCVFHYSQPGPCSVSCGGGTQTLTLIIITPSSGYGKPCPTLQVKTQTCNLQPCPIDCEFERGVFGQCSTTCDQGTKTRQGRIIRQAQHGGVPCPLESELFEQMPCNQGPCPVPVHCKVQYGEYGACSGVCGKGTQTRQAFIAVQPQNGGAPCPDVNALIDTRECDTGIPCSEPKQICTLIGKPIGILACKFIYGPFGECSASCGSGTRARKLYIVSQPEAGGQACPQEKVEREYCNLGECPQPQDCEVSFPDYGPCSAQCNGGSQTTTGQIIRPALNGGAACPSQLELTITRRCNTFPCITITPRDCEMIYGQWSVCIGACGQGTQYRKQYVKIEGEPGAQPCPPLSQRLESRPCQLPPCVIPKDCEYRRGYFGACSKPCGGGTQTQTITVIQPAENGGRPCPSPVTRPCNTQPCTTGYGTRFQQPQQFRQQAIRQRTSFNL